MRNVRRMIGPALLIAGVTALVGSVAVAQRGGNDDTTGASTVSARAAGVKRVTRAQRENAEARVELATAIVEGLQAEATAKGLSADWRRAALETLLPMSRAALEQVAQRAHNMDALAVARAEVAADPNLIGDPNRDLTYTPIVPCRFIDTRVLGGKINGTVDYDTSGNGAAYGGSAACAPQTLFGVTDDEQIGALAMNVTIVDPTVAPGFAAAKPTGAAPTTSLVNWYEAGPTVQAANQGIVSTNQAPPGTTTNFVIQTSGPVHVIVDLFGAFIEPQATALNVTTVTNSVLIAAGDAGSILQATCPAGTSMTGGGCNFGPFSSQLYFISSNPVPGSNLAWNCAVRNNSGGVAYTLTAYVRCGSIPGR